MCVDFQKFTMCGLRTVLPNDVDIVCLDMIRSSTQIRCILFYRPPVSGDESRVTAELLHTRHSCRPPPAPCQQLYLLIWIVPTLTDSLTHRLTVKSMIFLSISWSITDLHSLLPNPLDVIMSADDTYLIIPDINSSLIPMNSTSPNGPVLITLNWTQISRMKW